MIFIRKEWYIWWFLKFKTLYEIPYDTIYESLKFDYNLACTHCNGKIDIFCNVTSSKKVNLDICLIEHVVTSDRKRSILLLKTIKYFDT